MSNETKAFGPYNFIPFPEKIIERYKSVDELPAHDSINPELYSGEIRIKVTAETPLFISSGSGDRENPKFFRDPAGRLCIPGSSFRGMVRENVQILSLGLVAPEDDIEDYHIYYRNMAKTRTEAGRNQSKKYRSIIPENVSAGYLSCRDKKYYITPLDSPLRISSRDMGKFPALDSLDGVFTRVEDIIYKSQGETVTALKLYDGHIPDGFSRGKLLIPGKPIGYNPDKTKQNRKAYSLYIFGTAGSAADRIPVSDNDITSYRSDYESKKNSFNEKEKDFWRIKEDDFDEWPVFYMCNEKGDISLGRSRYLRIAYDKSIAAGLPKVHLQLKSEDRPVLDYARSIFGFSTEKFSYKSRVSFENMECISEDAKEGAPVSIMLLGPKPSFYTGYISDGKTYDNDFSLRGYKQYWFKDPVPNTEDAAIATKIAPLNAGSRFSGTIHFRNLAADELGLLLWALLPYKDKYNALGQGKPYGYGRISVKLSGMTKLNAKSAYSSPDMSDANESILNGAAELITIYKEKAAQLYGSKIDNTKTIESFLYMHSTIMSDNSKYKYPDIRDFQGFDSPLPTVLEIKNNVKNANRDK